MALTPFKAKAEERIRLLCKDAKPEADTKVEEPAAKRLCSVYEKQLAKLPAGDQGLVKDPLSMLVIFVKGIPKTFDI